MNLIFSQCKSLILCAALVLSFSVGQSVVSQHQGHSMPGMSKPKPKKKVKRKTAPRKNRVATRRRPAAKKHVMSNMPARTQRPATSPTSRSTQGILGAKPEPKPEASPTLATPAEKMDPHMHKPGVQTPATPSSPAASPDKEPHLHTPGMPMPATTPAPSASPEKTDPHVPGASPSPGTSDHQMENMPGMGSKGMNMGPLMVMSGDDIGIRVGASDTNIMSMGAMGSGTTWQPSSGPMYMHHKVAGDWLLIFHYNLVLGVNRQGGPRGVTKAESANWFMPMAYHKLGKGTVQLRGMFSFEPFTFPPGARRSSFRPVRPIKANH